MKVPKWHRVLSARLRLYGHRNWIVVADSAYPSQCGGGIETIAADGGHVEILETVLSAIDRAGHVRPLVFIDAELSVLSEPDAPGVGSFRDRLLKTLGPLTATPLPHEEAISRLDKASMTFNALVIKTKMTLPYTTVFLQLDCGYWNDAAEKHLRVLLQKQG